MTPPHGHATVTWSLSDISDTERVGSDVARYRLVWPQLYVVGKHFSYYIFILSKVQGQFSDVQVMISRLTLYFFTVK